MSNEPFFELDGNRFIPTAQAQGSWAAGFLHGRAVIGLIGFELERQYCDPDFLPSRLTVDLYRMPPAAPFEIQTRWLRQGGRVRLAEAELVVDGKSCARALLQFLRTSDAPESLVWKRDKWKAPAPAELKDAGIMDGRWEFKPTSADFSDISRARGAWTRETRELLGGFPLTPFARVAGAIDTMSAVANSNNKSGLDYINSDLTLYLHRPLIGEWVGLEGADHGAAAGVATGACFVHDETGPIGFAGCSALHQVHPPMAAQKA